MAGFPPPCLTCAEAMHERIIVRRVLVWIVVCGDARTFWGAGQGGGPETVERWHEARGYREARVAIRAAKLLGPWPEANS